MELVIFSELHQFKNVLMPYLLENEAINSVLIGALLKANEMTNLNLVIVFQGVQLKVAGMHTHERILMLSEGTEEALALVANYFFQHNQVISGLRGPAYSVDIFCKTWFNLTSFSFHRHMNLNVYQLGKISSQLLSPGQLYKAELSDIIFLKSWIERFIIEVELDQVDSNLILNKLIEEGRLYLWEDGKIVSMAAYSGATSNGVRINLVYTPQSYRGNGYATTCVTALSRHLLEDGYKKCFIFADKKNQTANAIYTKIGFELVGSYADCTLTKEAEIFNRMMERN